MLFCRKKFQIKYFLLPPFPGKPLFPVPPLPVNKQRRESLDGLKAFDEMINGPTEGMTTHRDGGLEGCQRWPVS
jgi:hypothetical protein